jgi:hypothetical protein
MWPAKEEMELMFLQNVVPLPNCTASHTNTLKSVIWSSYKHDISENGSVLVIREEQFLLSWVYQIPDPVTDFLVILNLTLLTPYT